MGSLLFVFFIFNSYAQDNSLTTTTTTVKDSTEQTNIDKISDSEKENFEANQELQTITVTGSYIRRTVKEGSPSPVTTINNSTMQETGNYTFSDTIKESAVGSTGNFGSSISFHGQSAANNLVLLNGMRLPKTAGGEYVDIDFIPSSAIEKVELLKDGASALYGSEALAGVVNIITKSQADESSIMIRQMAPELGVGSETNVIGSFAKNWRRGNFLAVAQFRRSQEVEYADTQYGMVDVTKSGSTASNYANLSDNSGNNFRAADCPVNRIDDRGRCRYNYYDTLSIQPEKQFYNLLLSGNLDAGNRVRVEAMALYTHRDWTLRNTPAIVQLENMRNQNGMGSDYSLKPETVSKWGPQILTTKGEQVGTTDFTDNLTLRYSADEELGRRISDREVHNIISQVRVTQQFSKNWSWEASAGYGITLFKDTLESGNARRDVLVRMADEGRFNPLKPAGAKDNLSEAMVETWYRHTSDVINTKALTTGPLFNIGARPLYMAIGVEGQRQSFRFENDPYSLLGLPLTGASSNQGGDRTVGSGFLELSHDITQDWQMQLAGRFDNYSDFGSTVNPKVGMTYQLSKKAALRTSWGTGFKAPGLLPVYQGDLTQVERLRDHVACSTKGTDHPDCNNLYSATSFGDENLQPELGQHFNIGFKVLPKKGWSLAVDHWRAQGKQALTFINLSDLTRVENLYGQAYVENALGVDIIRDSNGTLQNIRYPLQTNSGTYRVNGIDFELAYKGLINPLGLGAYTFIFKTEQSHTISSERQDFFFTPSERIRDLNWKNVTSLGFAKGSHFAKWKVRTYSGQDRDYDSPADIAIGRGSIPTYSEHDIHYEYYGAWNGVIALGVKNIFNTTLTNEFNRGTPGFILPASSTLLGRTFYASYEQTF